MEKSFIKIAEDVQALMLSHAQHVINRIEKDIDHLKSGSLFEKQMAFNRLLFITKQVEMTLSVVMPALMTGNNLQLTSQLEECKATTSNLRAIGLHPLFERKDDLTPTHEC